MRFADTPLSPAVFRDPARRQKLEKAFPEIDRLLDETLKKQKLPGIALGVVIVTDGKGELAYKKALGLRDTATRAPVTTDTVFRIASLTKSFTAMSILKLRDEGKLSLEDPAARWVPELRTLAYPTRDSAPITIRQLLSHGAGFPEDNPWGDRQLGMSEDDFSKFLAHGIPFSTAPATAFEYSNVGFTILGRVVQNVSGESARDYVTANFLRPLGMNATVFDESEVPSDKMARGYRREGEALVAEKNLPHGAFGMMGGLYSSLEDMARYAAFHLAAWPPRDDADTGPLRRSSLREMQQAARPTGFWVKPANEEHPLEVIAGGYGFGLGASRNCDFDHIVMHTGGLPGYGSVMLLLPEYGVGVVALANLTYAAPTQSARDVLRLLQATGGLQKRTVRPAPALVSAVEAVNGLLAHWDERAADAIFEGSFYLDVPKAKTRADFEALQAEHGACKPEGEIDAENALRGKWRLLCERGWIDLSLTLAPTLPPRIQALTKEGGLPPKTPSPREDKGRCAR